MKSTTIITKHNDIRQTEPKNTAFLKKKRQEFIIKMELASNTRTCFATHSTARSPHLVHLIVANIPCASDNDVAVVWFLPSAKKYGVSTIKSIRTSSRQPQENQIKKLAQARRRAMTERRTSQFSNTLHGSKHEFCLWDHWALIQIANFTQRQNEIVDTEEIRKNGPGFKMVNRILVVWN
jgi:hypothetical protein